MQHRILILYFTALAFSCGFALAQSGNDLSSKGEVGIRRIETPENMKELRLAIAWGDRLKPPSQYQQAIINLRDALKKWTTIPVSIAGQFRIGSPDLMKFPIVFISTDEQFDLTETERQNLREYIRRGGFLVLDDAGSHIPNSPSGAALLNVAREVAGEPLVQLSPNHPIFQSPFLLDGPPRGNENTPFKISEVSIANRDFRVLSDEGEPLLGAFIGDRLSLLYSPRGYYAKWNDSRSTPQLKFGVNLVMYALGIE
jgi:hypothetical protein